MAVKKLDNELLTSTRTLGYAHMTIPRVMLELMPCWTLPPTICKRVGPAEQRFRSCPQVSEHPAPVRLPVRDNGATAQRLFVRGPNRVLAEKSGISTTNPRVSVYQPRVSKLLSRPTSTSVGRGRATFRATGLSRQRVFLWLSRLKMSFSRLFT